jgi:hypothetical protein
MEIGKRISVSVEDHVASFFIFLRRGLSMKYLFLILCLPLAIVSVHSEVYSQDAITRQQPAGSSENEEIPSIEVPERTHHLGKMSLDRRYEHTFKVYNTGTGLLEIERVIVG